MADKVELGIMIETPAAVMMSAELAREVDFFSVGTNDLTQYTLAVDRQGVGLDRFFDAHHPAVLRMIRMTAENAHRAGIWIGICGELGADAELTETFLSMGIDELSVSPSAVLPLRVGHPVDRHDNACSAGAVKRIKAVVLFTFEKGNTAFFCFHPRCRRTR